MSKKRLWLQTRGIHIVFFLFLHKNICCGYSLEASHWDASNEYPQHMFSWRNKKIFNTFPLKNVPYLELCPYIPSLDMDCIFTLLWRMHEYACIKDALTFAAISYRHNSFVVFSTSAALHCFSFKTPRTNWNAIWNLSHGKLKSVLRSLHQILISSNETDWRLPLDTGLNYNPQQKPPSLKHLLKNQELSFHSCLYLTCFWEGP